MFSLARRDTLQELSIGRDNNFNLIRLLAAFGVLASHAFPLTEGYGAPQPLTRSLGHDLGTLCVFMFFGLSGFLVAQSYDRQKSVIAWGAARALRILPALVVVVLLCALALGPVFTTLPLAEYFSREETYLFIKREASLLWRQQALPGVFESNPYGPTVNGSIWTLHYEVVCYLFVLAIGLFAFLRSHTRFAIILGVFVGIYLVDNFLIMSPQLSRYLFLGLPFIVGTAFYVYRRWIVLSWAVAAAGAALVLLMSYPAGPTGLSRAALVVVLVYWVFVLAHLPGGAIRRFNGVGDYSYGLYLYAWPTQQAVVAMSETTSPWVGIALSTPIALGLAALSWRFVEKPALDARPAVTAWLRRTVDRARVAVRRLLEPGRHGHRLPQSRGDDRRGAQGGAPPRP